MAQQANIVLDNGATLPVAVLFTPTAPGVWHARASGIASQYEKLELAAKPCDLNDPKGVWMSTLTISDPVLEAQPANAVGADGYTAAPRQAFIERSKHIFYHNPRATPAQIEDIYAFARNALADAQVKEFMTKFIESAT